MRSSSILLLAPLLTLASAIPDGSSASGVVYEATVTIAEDLPDVTYTSYTTITLPHGATAPAGNHVSTITAVSTSRWTEYPSATGGAKPTNGTVIVAQPKPSTSEPVVKEEKGAAGRNVAATGVAVLAGIVALWGL